MIFALTMLAISLQSSTLPIPVVPNGPVQTAMGAPSKSLQSTAPPAAIEPEGPIQTVMIGPAIDAPFACMEHPSGQLRLVGDALGTDCFVMAPSMRAGFMTLYEGRGAENEDWHGWGAPVLAPLDAEVVSVVVNGLVNSPGQPGIPPATTITFKSDDGVRVVYGHVRELMVREGDRVRQGEKIGTVGNDGMSRAPHIHIGAYRGLEPMQIRWDLRAIGALANPER